MVPNKPVQVDEDSIQTDTFELFLGRFKLCVVKYQGKIFIPIHEGLLVIGASPNWLEDLNQTRQNPTLLNSRRRPWQDWLILWKYFCNRGSTKAASLLRHLAAHGLEHYLVA
jgi:hypothetical protein